MRERSLADERHPADVVLPDTLTLEVGGTWSADLPGLGSAGYEWSLDAADSGEGEPVVIATLAYKPLSEAERPDPPVTYSAPSVVTVTAANPGRATVRLTLAQRWEPDRPVRSHDIDVRVNER